MEGYAIFGAGENGKRAFENCDSAEVVCFIDNDKSKAGKSYMGRPVLSLSEYKNTMGNLHIIIAVRDIKSVKEQLEKEGIYDYSVFFGWSKFKRHYPEDVLINNPYEDGKGFYGELDSATREYYNLYVEDLYNKNDIFESVEIETYNRCNGVCSFCPISVNHDTRIEKRMDESLFYKIIDELSEMEFKGRVALFSNNEPFLDDRIIEFQRYARNKLPYAYQYLYTNGTKLSLPIYKEIIELLDELIIDNYNQELRLIKNNKIIKEFCEANPEFIKKTTIVLRKPHEILTSRGGYAPNKEKEVRYGKDRCSLPFRQLIIRPSGEISLCCNDSLGITTMGDASKDKLINIWNNKTYKKLREQMMQGRENIPQCRYCDTF